MFHDREDAAKQLATALNRYKDSNVVVLGIPRGGVEVAYHVARHLHSDFSLIIIRKLGYPDNPEAAFGAIDEDLNISLSEGADKSVTYKELVNIIDNETREIERRVNVLRKGKPLPDLTGKTVIIVDDGVATGATIFSAISLCRKRNPSRLVVAAPIAGPDMKYRLQELADDVVLLDTPTVFYAVGQGYENFENLTDAQTSSFIERWDRDHIQQVT